MRRHDNRHHPSRQLDHRHAERRLAFCAGVAGAAAYGIVEWPMAVPTEWGTPCPPTDTTGR